MFFGLLALRRTAPLDLLETKQHLAPRDRAPWSTSKGIGRILSVMGTSVAMIERHYGTLLDGAEAGIASRLDEFDAVADHRPGSMEESS